MVKDDIKPHNVKEALLDVFCDECYDSGNCGGCCVDNAMRGAYQGEEEHD